MNKTRVAINGFGRIGRSFLKLALDRDDLDIVAINDLGDRENLIYLLKYDSVYGRYEKNISITDSSLEIDGDEIKFLQEKDPSLLPWRDLNIDIVIEATGAFESYEKASVHIAAGAKKVVLAAPAKDEDTETARTVLMGINDDDLRVCTISSNASCTTNSAHPVMQVLIENLGVKKAFLNTVHGYTATQSLTDGPTKGHDFRRGRAAAINISPSTTGAAIAVARAVTELKGKFDGIALRVPVITGSISAISFVAARPTSTEEINSILKKAESEERWRGILKTTSDQLVSTDIIGDPHAAIVDLSLTKVVDGDLGCVYSWYDNEFGYTNTLLAHVLKVAGTLK